MDVSLPRGFSGVASHVSSRYLNDLAVLDGATGKLFFLFCGTLSEHFSKSSRLPGKASLAYILIIHIGRVQWAVLGH